MKSRDHASKVRQRSQKRRWSSSGFAESSPRNLPFNLLLTNPSKAPTLFILQQWRRAHRLESTAGRCHGLRLDLTTRARRRQRIAVDATIRDPRRVRLDPDRDR